ncbi:MAG TPA: biotin transporter BioY [Mycobacteriales bacterium]|nr:biotin transporter BioY [Mycobacteriales bacterium]
MSTIALPRPSFVLADTLPRGHARDALLIIGGAGLTGLAAQVSIPIPGTPVPVTGQTFAVLLVGAALGWWRALTAMALYLLAGAVGVPWYADGSSGWGGPSFGYIVGFVIAATVVGWLAGRGGDRTPLRTVATMTLGTLLIYAVGVPWLAASIDVGLAKAIELGARPFLGGDALKVLLAAGVLPAAWHLLGPRGDND